MIVDGDRQLCSNCWQSMTFLTGEGCVLCNVPLSVAGQICAPCLAHPPDHDGVRSVVAYGGIATTIILRLKHGRRTALAHYFGEGLSRHADHSLDMLCPVPLHRWRIWQRGFNQSALIASAIGRQTGLRIENQLLLRRKRTPLLRGLSPRARLDAVRGAFLINPAAAVDVTGLSIGLIDDVYTTGATSNACARVLKHAGAKRVVILSWARVLRGND